MLFCLDDEVMKSPQKARARGPQVVYVLVIKSADSNLQKASEPAVYASREIAKNAAIIAASPPDFNQRGQWVTPLGKLGKWVETIYGELPAVEAYGADGSRFTVYTCPVHESA